MKISVWPIIAVAVLFGASAFWVGAEDAPSVVWQPSWAQASELARRQEQPMLVYFGATWCGPCRKLEKETFPQADVVRASRRWINFKADLDEQDDLAARYSVETPPTLLFLDSKGRVMDKLVGFYNAKVVVAKMESAFKKRVQKP